MKITLDHARRAKKEIIPLLQNIKEFSGIGITQFNSQYALKINLVHETRDYIPKEVLGIQVVVEIVGVITTQ